MCLQTSADSSYAATVGFGSAEVRMKDTRYVIILQTSSVTSLLGALAYNGMVRLVKAPKKCNSLDYIHISEKAGVQFFGELGYKLVDDNDPIHRSHAVNK